MTSATFPSFLQTGDSKALHKDLLIEVVKALVSKCGCKPLRRCEDKVGVYAYVLQDPYGKSFYLIAKGSRLYRDVISCQAYLPNRARDEKRPIMLAWLNEGDLKFYLFDSEQIVQDNYGMNDRQGVRMVNFSIKLGTRFEPLLNVAKILEKARKPKDTSQKKLV